MNQITFYYIINTTNYHGNTIIAIITTLNLLARKLALCMLHSDMTNPGYTTVMIFYNFPIFKKFISPLSHDIFEKFFLHSTLLFISFNLIPHLTWYTLRII